MTAGEERAVTSPEDLRRLPVADMIAWLSEHGEPEDPRPGLDTDSLIERFPHLAHVRITDVSVEGRGGTLPGRSYVDPSAIASGYALVWAHGGAFVGGTLDMPESHWFALELASRGLPVLSVDYRKCLSGVHYPAPSDDILTWWDAAVAHSATWLGVDSTHVLLGGASAGSTLTAGAVRRLVDDGRAVPAGLVLVYPALHPDSTDPSVAPAVAADVPELALNYAGSLDAVADPQVFAGLGDGSLYPPTLVVGCELDGFLPSAAHFDRTLTAAGVASTLRVEAGSDHGHINDPADPGARRTIVAIREWVDTL